MSAKRQVRIEGPRGGEIRSLEDWFKHAPPKKREDHWWPGRSAMELARAWLDDDRGPTVPAEIAGLLDSHELIRGFEPVVAIPELVTALDEFAGENRNHDLVVEGEGPSGRTLLAIEAKADEAFSSHTVESYLKASAAREKQRPAKVKDALAAGRRPPGRSNVPARIEHLCAAVFGPPESEAESVAAIAKPLRYQLVTALAGALIEAPARRCGLTVLIVHEFLSKPELERQISGTNASKVRRNAAAFRLFVEAVMPGSSYADGTLVGPSRVPGGAYVPGDVPFFVGKVTRHIN